MKGINGFSLKNCEVFLTNHCRKFSSLFLLISLSFSCWKNFSRHSGAHRRGWKINPPSLSTFLSVVSCHKDSREQIANKEMKWDLAVGCCYMLNEWNFMRVHRVVAKFNNIFVAFFTFFFFFHWTEVKSWLEKLRSTKKKVNFSLIFQLETQLITKLLIIPILFPFSWIFMTAHW